jgi:hypothetical protein
VSDMQAARAYSTRSSQQEAGLEVPARAPPTVRASPRCGALTPPMVSQLSSALTAVRLAAGS